MTGSELNGPVLPAHSSGALLRQLSPLQVRRRTRTSRAIRNGEAAPDPWALEESRLLYRLLWLPMLFAAIGVGLRRLLSRQRSGAPTVPTAPPVIEAEDPALVAWPAPCGLWAQIPDGQAVRNRVRLVKTAVVADLERRCPGGRGHVRLLSVGAYSSAGTIVGVSEFLSRNPGARVSVRIVDDRMPALGRLRACAEAAGVGSCVELVRAPPRAALVAEEPERWDIFEIAGLLDTVPFHEGVRMLQRVRRLAGPSGSVITAQLGPSAWTPILRSLSRWPQLYRRRAGDLGRLLGTAGFSHGRIEVSTEPHGICALAIRRPVQ